MIDVLVRAWRSGEKTAMKLFLAVSLLALLTTTAAVADPPAATDPAREKKELRLVEILHTMNKKPPPDAATQKALGDEYTQLLAYFGGVDLKNPPKDPAAQQKAQDAMMAAQGEILARRMAGDVWEIDEAGAVKAVTDLCATIK